ncbi:MAG TPA: metallophosphoesterase [Thermoplasmata archaeon]|nr:metallophosphoesterase [Thermoplasmata archaeon]
MARASFVFGHLADAHVGAWPRDPAVREALRKSVLRALDVVEERGCEFLLISGDLFHTPVPEPAEVAPIASALRRLVDSGRRVYVIYGSHDYIAHRTSWLDVLAETGIFLRAAPEPVHEEGARFTLGYHVDPPTGAVIAGISGRSHGLDAGVFRGIDSERFRAEPGFHIFQFHAAVREYLPEVLRPHIAGISRDDLPGGCDYYAGGHIHQSYVGEGPDGGLLVNPGAVFGTSVTDVAWASVPDHRAGLAIVTVRDGRPSVEHVPTAPRELVRVVEVNVDGRTPEQARELLAEEVRAASAPGALLFPKLRGTLAEGGPRTLGLKEATEGLEATGAAGVHWDLHEVVHAEAANPDAGRPESEIEADVLRQLAERAPEGLADLHGPEGQARLGELLRALGVPRGEGEARLDYVHARVDAGLRILNVRGRPITP